MDTDTKKLFEVNRRMVLGTVIGIVLFTLLSRFVWFNTPIAGTYFFPSFALLGLFATLFGPISGALISLTGMIIIGIWNHNVYISYTIASVVCGFIYGLAKKYVHADNGEFGYNGVVAYNLTQVVGNLASWAVLAPILELLLNSGRSAADVFMQGLMAAFVDILAAEFFGTPLLFIYSSIRRRQIRSAQAPAPAGGIDSQPGKNDT